MTIRHWFVALITFLGFLLAGIPVQAQTGSATSEEEVKKNAANFFDKGDYPAAFPLYSQLLATYPKDPNYNYRFGVCMLFANADKDKALPFLEKASKDPEAEKEVWFYLGKAYHLNYRFDEAIVAYSNFKKLAGSKKAEKLQVDNQIAMCKTGRKLLRAITDIEVLDKKELSRNDFFRSYDLTGYSGQLLVKPDEFKTSLDKKKNETSVIFLSGEKNEIYFSSYGEDEENGKDIYIVRRLPNGSLSKPTNIGYPINTEYDEDYPFLHPNGKVLYFCSKGHNSMGGYDIFRSELNEETNTWQKPVNLDFAINSPDDDILFITDMDEKSAYFASSRNSPDGQMTVYHVSIERKPVDMCLVKGNVRPVEGASSRSARILVKNEETGEPIGIYKSNETTGDYFINLPNIGGKFSFTVEKSGQETQTENVLFPAQYEMKPVRQEIGYREENGKPKLFVMTYFDDDTSMFSPEFLKQRAKLDVNYDGPEVTVINGGNNPVAGGNNPKNGSQNTTAGGNQTTNPEDDDTTDVAANVPSSQTKNITNEELVKIAFDDAKETKDEATDMRNEADRAMNYAVDLNEQTKEQTAKAEQAKTDADAMPEGQAKKQAQEQAAEEQAKANALQSQTVAAFGVAEALDRDADRKESESKLSDKYAASLDKAVKSKDPKALDALAPQEQELENIASGEPEGAETVKNLRANADTKRNELEKATAASNQLREENKQIQEKIQRLKQEEAAEKDPDLKAGLASQVEGMEEELADNNQDLKKADAKEARLQNEVNALDNQVEGATNVLAQAKNTALPPKKVEADVLASVKQDVAGYERQVIENGGVPVAGISAPKNNGGNDPVAGGNNTTNNGGNNTTNNGGNNTTNNGGNDPLAGGNNATNNGGNNTTNNGGNNTTTNGGNDPVAGGNNTTNNGGNNTTNNGGNDPVAGGNNTTNNGVNNTTNNGGNDPVAGG
ncbi:MAG: hypothetical protein ACRCYO_14625, partial [Bacteroidia bacterium]